MNLQNRIAVLQQLRQYLIENGADWQQAKATAEIKNGWFIQAFIDQAVQNIVHTFLDPDQLQQWAGHYHLNDSIQPANVGIVMAGNIPLVGFHDFLCVFISGHRQNIKLSSKDDVLLKHMIEYLYRIEPSIQSLVTIAPMLKSCDAYIATGSNNTGTYFDQYFGKYPSIIRRNRTSVAILQGDETMETLEKLSADIHTYFGLGCRNVTKLYVPEGYDFVPMLQSFHQFKYFADHHKYRNNYDYNLSVHIMNNRFYMTNDTTMLIENEALFSPISQVNYSYYSDKTALAATLQGSNDVQCIVGLDVAFGAAQQPSLVQYADGVDTMQFLLTL